MSRGDFNVTTGAGEYRVCMDGRRRDRTYGRFADAEAAALRLAAAHPQETFIITQEVARASVHRR